MLTLLRPASNDACVPKDTDWQELAQLVDRLWLGTRLATRAGSREEIPEALRTQWSQTRLATAARNLLLEREEAQLRETLLAAGVESIPLKGTSLARILAGDPATRPVTDIDLGLRSADVARATHALRQAGYEVLLSGALLARPSFLKATDEHTSEVKCTRKAAGIEVVVELHWKWVPLPEEVIWSSLVTYDKAGVRTLCPEHYFLFLCAHLAGGGWAGLRWLCDLADFLLVLAPRMDASRCLEFAAKAGLRRAVGITLALLDEFFGVSYLPLGSLVDETARRAARQYCLRPFQPFLTGTPAGIHRDRLRIQDNPWRRFRYVARLLRPTHLEWLTPEGKVRRAASAWAVRASRLAHLFSSNGGAT